MKSENHSHFAILGAELWTASGVLGPHTIECRNGICTSLIPGENTPSKGAKVIDARGLALLPAGVDGQVHLRVPGQHVKETAESGLRAAIAGGVGALLTMPNTKPVLDQPRFLLDARSELAPYEDYFGVKVLLSSAITLGQKGQSLVDVEGVIRAGAVALTDDGVGVARDDVMESALSQAARFGVPILQHAEVPGHHSVLAEGPIQQKLGLEPYRSTCETEMVARDLDLLKRYPLAKYHVLHVSSKDTLELIQQAKNSGLHATCEVSPHHLFFTSEDIRENNSSFKMNPPLRQSFDREALQIGLQNGLIDFVATDHAPHENDVKTTNFKTSAFGTTGLETSLRVLFNLWRNGKLSAERLVQVWATVPAAYFGLDASFQGPSIGQPLRVVLCDPYFHDTLVLSRDLRGLSKNSCFVGQKLSGKIYTTILGSKVHNLH